MGEISGVRSSDVPPKEFAFVFCELVTFLYFFHFDKNAVLIVEIKYDQMLK